jgi:imidazolonepropionase-like amidohydrolase
MLPLTRTSPALLLALVLTGTPPRPADPPLVLRRVTIIDLETGRLFSDRTVTIQGDRIARIDSGPATTPSGATVVEGRGRYLLPGFWDMHVHLGDDTARARALLRFGITGARDMGGELEESLALRAALQADPSSGPRLLIAGFALRGPSAPDDSGDEVVRTPLDAERIVDRLASRGVDFIKVHENLSPDTWYAIARRARRHHLAVVGHVPAGMTPEATADSGERSIEHLEFLPDRCLPGQRGSEGSGGSGECSQADLVRLLAHLAQDSVWLDPTIGSFRVWAPAMWPEILQGFHQLVPLIQAAGLPILAGTDLGDRRFIAGQSLHDELALLVDAGFSPLDALRAATSNPARFLNLGDSLGAVKPGMIADLVLLERNPLADIDATTGIALVVREGRVVK